MRFVDYYLSAATGASAWVLAILAIIATTDAHDAIAPLGHHRPAILASRPVVAEELKLTEAQSLAIVRLARESRGGAAASAQVSLLRVLTPAQADRLAEIRCQCMGALALVDEETSDELSLSDAQKEEVKRVIKSEVKILEWNMAAVRFVDGAAIRDYVCRFWRTDAPLLKILDDRQRATLRRMQGAEFGHLDGF